MDLRVVWSMEKYICWWRRGTQYIERLKDMGIPSPKPVADRVSSVWRRCFGRYLITDWPRFQSNLRSKYNDKAHNRKNFGTSQEWFNEPLVRQCKRSWEQTTLRGDQLGIKKLMCGPIWVVINVGGDQYGIWELPSKEVTNMGASMSVCLHGRRNKCVTIWAHQRESRFQKIDVLQVILTRLLLV